MSALTHPLQHVSGKDQRDTSVEHEGTVSSGGKTITSLCFSDDIDGLAGEEEEVAKLVEYVEHRDQC